MKELKTLTFEDSPGGRSEMAEQITFHSRYGWELKSKETSQQGWDCMSTCCLGALFLPLALLGKKQRIITVILEREQTTETETLDEKMAMEVQAKEKQSISTGSWSDLFTYVLIGLGIFIGASVVIAILQPVAGVMQYIFSIFSVISFVLIWKPSLAKKYGKITLTRKTAIIIMLTVGYIFIAMLEAVNP